jgi:competence protein ComEC
VGHGNCTVLVDTDGVVVIDAGPKSKLFKFLKEKHITKIDVLLLSHADQDHIIGVSDLLASGEIEIKKVYVNTDSTKKSNQ